MTLPTALASDALVANFPVSLEMGVGASLTCHASLFNVNHKHTAKLALVSLDSGDMSQRPVPTHKCPGTALIKTLLLFKKLHALCVTLSPSTAPSDLPVEMFFL